MPLPQSVEVPMDLIQRIATYIQSVPTGNQPAGVALAIIVELDKLASPKPE